MSHRAGGGDRGDRETLAHAFEVCSMWADRLGSPFYRDLERHMAADVRAGGPVWDFLAPYPLGRVDDVYPLRLLGGIHRAVLAGRLPPLAAHFPSTGGDGDVVATLDLVREVLRGPHPGPDAGPDAASEAVRDALSRPPQTNEVGRSGALVPGMLVVAQETGLPLRLREVGASAGLNLRVDAYRYESRGEGWGDRDSPVRFVDLWGPGQPPFGFDARVVDRRGCDRDPIDATDPEAALTLLSYVWPGQEERFALLRAALDVARDRPVTIDRAEAVDWIAHELDDRVHGVATIVYHSVVWQYFDEATRDAIRADFARAGASATADAPIAWLRLEGPDGGQHPPDLRLTLWNGRERSGEERVLATAGFHGGRVTWPASPSHPE